MTGSNGAPGVVPRAIRALFAALVARSAGAASARSPTRCGGSAWLFAQDGGSWEVRVTVAEVYNETVRCVPADDVRVCAREWCLWGTAPQRLAPRRRTACARLRLRRVRCNGKAGRKGLPRRRQRVSTVTCVCVCARVCARSAFISPCPADRHSAQNGAISRRDGPCGGCARGYAALRRCALAGPHSPLPPLPRRRVLACRAGCGGGAGPH